MGILKKYFLALLIIVLSIRLSLIVLPSFTIDMNDWLAWSARLVQVTPLHFYSPDYFSDYFPGYLYILWFSGSLFDLLAPKLSIFSPFFQYYLKFITNIFDIATAYFIYKIVANYRKGTGWQVLLFYLANPALFFNSSIWGQVDGILTFFLVYSTYCLIELKNTFKFNLAFALSILIKPQGLAIFPPLLVYLISYLKPSKIFGLLSIPVLLIFLSLPFFLQDPILGLFHLFQKSASTYPYTAMFSYNFWSLVGWWIPDSTKFLNLSYQTWGIIIYLLFLTIILVPLLIKRRYKDKECIYFALTLAIFAFFLFLTRMHERYLYPFFAFLAITTLIQNSFKLKVIYFILSFIHFINLWHVYYYYNYVFHNSQFASFPVYQILSSSYNWLSLASLTSFGVLLGLYLNKTFKFKIMFNPRLILKYILIFILISSAFLRLFRLDYPNKYIFDEVYHAYTAKEYLKGNRDAWSPWGKSPPGVAFEWLHPPIAKELMTASMFVLHTTDAWAWRIPGTLLGILSILLIYILALQLFKDKLLAIFSALIFSIDGLVFVQSRIGMNDVYLVAFVLISTIFFVKKSYFWAALFMGVALATKWSGVYLALLYFPILLYRRQFKQLIFFLLLPPIVYLVSYTPYFLAGYNLNDFIELHRQIWLYQTNLKATHAYSSPWWSWPINLYPVWYFVDYQKNSMANIFASGNPLVFWVGAASIIITAWEAFRNRAFNLIFIVLGFLVFWAPWAFSPRIMFFYHFSPSVPFLSLALAYQLREEFRNPKRRQYVFILLALMLTTFILIFPFLTGIHLPREFIKLFFTTNISKNPF